MLHKQQLKSKEETAVAAGDPSGKKEKEGRNLRAFHLPPEAFST